MKQWWTQAQTRIDAMSLRERVFLFLSVIFVLLALVDAVWLTPTQTLHKQASQRFATQADELVRLRAELTAGGKPVDPSQAVRDEMAAVDAQIAKTNQAIAAAAPMADKGPNLEQVLVQFLRRYEGLTLISTGTLTADAPLSSNVAGANAGAMAGIPAVAGLTKRGMELRVSGPYAEMVRYVRALESALPTLRWGELQVKSDVQPTELGLQVYVVGVAP